jgi:subtilisin family serine protease
MSVMAVLWFFLNQQDRLGVDPAQTAGRVSETSSLSPASKTAAKAGSGSDSILSNSSMPDPGRKVEIPAPDASEAEVMSFRKKLAEGYQPEDPQASRNFPSSEEFMLDCDGPLTRLHVALNEVYLPTNGGKEEIVEIPPARNLKEWQQQAAQLSPQAGMVLYFPDRPRTDGNMRILSRALIVQPSSEEELKEQATKRGWVVLRPLAQDGPFLVEEGNALRALETLRHASFAPGFAVSGDFRRVAVRRQGNSQPELSLPSQIPRPLPRVPAPAKTPPTQKRFVPNDPLFTTQWHLRNTNTSATSVAGLDVNVTAAWDTGRGSNVVIGIVDDGLEISHPDLKTNVASGLHYNWAGGDSSDPSPRSPVDDHGTSVAGLAAGRGNNSLGISGVAPSASLAGLRLVSGTVSDANQISMLNWKLAEIAIKNNSWGLGQDNGLDYYLLPSAVAAAMGKAVQSGRNGLGTVLVWANGNGNVDGVYEYLYPTFCWDCSQWDEQANSVNVIAVAAVSSLGRVSSYSEYGANIAVSAPSSSAGTPGLVTTAINAGYTSGFSGTSGAAPLVSGVVALMLEANPDLGWRDVKEVLMRTARVVDGADSLWITNSAGFNFHPLYGAGLVNASEAVRVAAEQNKLATMTSTSLEKTNLNLKPADVDTNGVSVEFSLGSSFRTESVALKWTGTGYAVHDLVFYITSPKGTTVRMNAVRRNDYSTLGYTNVVFTTPFFWGEPSAGTWKVKVTDEFLFGAQKTVSLLGLTWYGSSSPVAPSNDPFETPLGFRGTSGSSSVSNEGATRQSGEPNHAAGKGGGSLWWRIQPSVNGHLTLDTLGSSVSDTLLAVYSGATLTNLTVIASNDDISSSNRLSRIVRLPVETSNDLRIVVDGKNRSRGTVKLNFVLQAGAVYDNFAEPKVVTGTNWTDSGRNNGSTPAYSAESGEKPHAGQAAFKSVWYRWTPGVTGTAEVTTTNVNFPTVLAVYRGSTVDTLTPIASNAGTTSRKTSRVQFGVRPEEVYYVVVDGRSRSAGTYTLQGLVHGAPPLSGTNRPPLTPTNQLATNAVTLAGARVSTSGNNLSAAKGSSGGPSVWYRWTAPKAGTVFLNTSGSGFDTILAAYTEAMVNKGSNDNARSGVRWSQVSFQADAGTTYMIEVSGARGSSGRFKLNLSQ